MAAASSRSRSRTRRGWRSTLQSQPLAWGHTGYPAPPREECGAPPRCAARGRGVTRRELPRDVQRAPRGAGPGASQPGRRPSGPPPPRKARAALRGRLSRRGFGRFVRGRKASGCLFTAPEPCLLLLWGFRESLRQSWKP